MRIYFIVLVTFLSSLTAFGQNENKSKYQARPDLPGKLMFDYGYNFLQNNPSDFGVRGIQSKSVGLHYSKEFFPINKLSFSVGAGFAFEKLSFTGRNLLSYELDGDNTLSYAPAANDILIDKSKLATTYVQLPIDIRFYPKGEGVGTRFFVGVGGYIGYLLEAHNKISYASNDVKQTKQRGSFGLNEFRYGMTLKLGFDNIHFLYKYDFSELFQSNNAPLDNGNANVWSAGLSINIF